MLTSVLPIFEVLAEGVQRQFPSVSPRNAVCSFLPHTEIDLITAPRSQSNTAVLYLLMPTAKNVDLILQDFNPNPLSTAKSSKKTKGDAQVSSPKYSQAHVHFLDGMYSLF